jgi:organic radical activating enzyme
MDCRVLRQIMLKADGHLCCDDSNGYFVNLGEVSTAKAWNIRHVLDGGIYAHVRRSFAAGTVPWPGICETCDLFSAGGTPRDTLGSRLRLMIEPTLACHLQCPGCKRGQEAARRAGQWTLGPAVLDALLASLQANRIDLEEVHYLGWGEPLLHPQFATLTRQVRERFPNAVQEVTTSGNADSTACLDGAAVDRVVFSADGARQDSYERYRKKGSLETAVSLMRAARQSCPDAFLEWKYIVFEFNDTDEQLLAAQHLADEIGLDSILFILTNSKWQSTRFTPENIRDFPRISARCSVSPAAALLKTTAVAKISPGRNGLGDKAHATFYLDSARLTESGLLMMEGWAATSLGTRVQAIRCFDGEVLLGQTTTVHRRVDVIQIRPSMSFATSGYLFRIPVDEMRMAALRFEVETEWGLERFDADLDFGGFAAASA